MESGKKATRGIATNSGESVSNHSLLQPFFGLLSHAGVVVQPLRRFLLVSLPPLATFIATVLLVLQPLADRHGGLFKRAETIIKLD